MIGQIIVPLRGCCFHLGQFVPWAAWEVMVLDMVSHVQIEKVPKTVVVVSLKSFHKLMMLGDNVDSSRVGPN